MKKKSFYFEDYTESDLVDNKNNLNIIKISLNRVTFLSFIFLSLILIFSIKIIYLSLSPEKSFYNSNIKKNLIKESIPDAEISIQDLAGDENHYSATIKSKIFNGRSKIEQHKMVYKSLKGKMGNELHALAIKTQEKNGSTN